MKPKMGFIVDRVLERVEIAAHPERPGLVCLTCDASTDRVFDLSVVWRGVEGEDAPSLAYVGCVRCTHLVLDAIRLGWPGIHVLSREDRVCA